MAKRIRETKVGDIFSVQTDEKTKKYMQYIVSDLTQLNSDVIRVFKKSYPIDDKPDLKNIINDNVEFYAHCDTKAGIIQGLWELVGNDANVRETDHILFRDSRDYGN